MSETGQKCANKKTSFNSTKHKTLTNRNIHNCHNNKNRRNFGAKQGKN